MTTGNESSRRSLYAVAVEHSPNLCPLKQSGPVAAQRLADNLNVADLTGVFSMNAHRGVALIEADSATGLGETVARVLPNHKPPIIRTVPSGSLLNLFYSHPDWLEGADSQRYELFGLAAALFPEMDFLGTVANALPTLSLRSLPDYLRQNAPGYTSVTAR
jgi:hypothetical protein